MNLYKTLLLCLIVLLTACKHKKPAVVWFFDEESLTMLNGNVEQVSISYNSQPTYFFYRLYFDEQGNLTHSEKRALDIVQMEHETDSTIINETIKYSLKSHFNGNKIAIVGSISGVGVDKSKAEDKYTNKSKWEFDQRGRAIDYIEFIDGPSDTGRYRYNAAGDLIEYKRNYRSIADRDLYMYKYDQNHLIIESDFYDKKAVYPTNHDPHSKRS